MHAEIATLLATSLARHTEDMRRLKEREGKYKRGRWAVYGWCQIPDTKVYQFALYRFSKKSEAKRFRNRAGGTLGHFRQRFYGMNLVKEKRPYEWDYFDHKWSYPWLTTGMRHYKDSSTFSKGTGTSSTGLRDTQTESESSSR